MNDLTQKKCEACSIDTPPMQTPQIEQNLKMLHEEWQVNTENTQISRDVTFPDFKAGVAFIQQVADLAEQEGHHPDIYLHNYRRVRIDLMTHKIKGLSLNDFILAAKIDTLIT